MAIRNNTAGKFLLCIITVCLQGIKLTNYKLSIMKNYVDVSNIQTEDCRKYHI